MAMGSKRGCMGWTLAALLATASISFAQAPTAPAAPPVPSATAVAAAPPSPVSGIRNKLSAGDLRSAESILEVHRAKYGEDGGYLVGLSWLTRGALLLGEPDKARRYATDVRARCTDRAAHGADPAKDSNLETALGAAIEVEAQLIQRGRGARAAAEYVRGELAQVKGPVALRSRLNKRINLLTLVGSRAPELVVEDRLGDATPTLAALKGRPVVLFLWNAGCGDCKAQAPALARLATRYTNQELQVVALTRYYEKEVERAAEKAEVDSIWKAVYTDAGPVPVVFSTTSMERYGGSSTPTWVFVDRAGIVRGYVPYRLTEAEFDRALEKILR
jgi:cytochrome c biogenesis protein CcmG, thiol:disulfide interchange protein DsbE